MSCIMLEHSIYKYIYIYVYICVCVCIIMMVTDVLTPDRCQAVPNHCDDRARTIMNHIMNMRIAQQPSTNMIF